MFEVNCFLYGAGGGLNFIDPQADPYSGGLDLVCGGVTLNPKP